MKKAAFSLLSILLFSCGASSVKNTDKKPLFEVLTEQDDGGGTIHFFEIVSDSLDVKLLQNDENLQKKIKQTHSKPYNF